MARAKALAVRRDAASSLPVLAADTIVVIDELILGKPRERGRGRSPCSSGSRGARTQVLTAVALAGAAGLAFRLSASEVRFRALSRAECRAYWDERRAARQGGRLRGAGARRGIHRVTSTAATRASWGCRCLRPRELLRGGGRAVLAGGRSGKACREHRDPGQRRPARDARGDPRQRRGAGDPHRAHQPPRAGQQSLQGPRVARAARHAGGVRRDRARAHRVPARRRHRRHARRGHAARCAP